LEESMTRSLTVISLLLQSTTHCRYRVYTKFLLTYTAIYRGNRKVLPLGITALQPQSHFHLGTPYTLVDTYRRFGTNYRSHLQGSIRLGLSGPWRWDRLFWNARNFQFTLVTSRKNEDLIYKAVEAWNHEIQLSVFDKTFCSQFLMCISTESVHANATSSREGVLVLWEQYCSRPLQQKSLSRKPTRPDQATAAPIHILCNSLFNNYQIIRSYTTR